MFSMSTGRIESASGIYHVMAKGVGGQLIVEDDDDRRIFVSFLKEGIARAGVTLLAWCLMDNHVHLLMSCPIDGLSCCMGNLLSSYALVFNRRHGREGHLFQGRFKSVPIEDDAYLLTVVRYIHQNPVKANMTPTCDYPWSSYNEYTGNPELTNTETILSMFDGVKSLEEFHAIFDEDAEHDKDLEWDKRVSDEDALNHAIELFGDSGLGHIKAMPKEERNAAIRQLKDYGCTVRQIRRLTGLSLGTISKA